MRRVARVLAAVTLFVAGSAAAEQSSPNSQPAHAITLHWVAPEPCPDSASILRRVEGLVGRAVTGSANAPFSVEAKANQTSAEAWTLDLSFREAGNATSRAVTAATCDELGDAAALLIALAIDPNLAAVAGAAPGAPANPNAASTAPPTNPEAPPPVAPPRSAREARAVAAPKLESAPQPPIRFHAGALAALWLERLPGAAPGMLLTAGLSRYHWCVSAEFGFFPQQHAELPAAQTGGDIWLASAELNLAYAISGARLKLAPFAGLEFDWMRGSGTGQLRPDQGTTAFAAFGAGARLDYFVSPHWALQIRAKGSAPFARPSFYAGSAEVFRPGWLGAEIGLGAVVNF